MREKCENTDVTAAVAGRLALEAHEREVIQRKLADCKGDVNFYI
jgi:hypothetical protein